MQASSPIQRKYNQMKIKTHRKSIRILLILVILYGARLETLGAVTDSVRTIVLKAISGMQYDVVRFQVKPGEMITLSLTNQDDMAHNLVITEPEAREAVVNAALALGAKGPERDYIPESEHVLWTIPVTYPGEKKAITFQAPKKEGAYPYVCTYPGHGFLMYGVMYVTKTGEAMPDLASDLHVPEARRQEPRSTRPHPYELSPPYWYRAFLEETSLASIAVHLPQQLSYCWDTELCQLRYAWEGGFLDNADLWHGHKNAYAKILGTIFFKDKVTKPLRFGTPDAAPPVEYKGYRVRDQYPEFHYTVAGKDVFELIKELPGKKGFIRTIRIPDATEPVWYCYDATSGVTYRFSAGIMQNGKVALTEAEAREFTIQMIKNEKP